MARHPQLGRKPKYDWELLLNGEPHELYENEDYDCTPQSFAALVRYNARVRGIELEQVSVDGECVFLQARKKKAS